MRVVYRRPGSDECAADKRAVSTSVRPAPAISQPWRSGPCPRRLGIRHDLPIQHGSALGPNITRALGFPRKRLADAPDIGPWSEHHPDGSQSNHGREVQLQPQGIYRDGGIFLWKCATLPLGCAISSPLGCRRASPEKDLYQGKHVYHVAFRGAERVQPRSVWRPGRRGYGYQLWLQPSRPSEHSAYRSGKRTVHVLDAKRQISSFAVLSPKLSCWTPILSSKASIRFDIGVCCGITM